MTDQQLSTVVGLIAGMELAVVHLGNVLASQAGVPREQLVESFRATARAIPQDAANRQLLAMVLEQIARGLESSTGASEFEETVRRLLH